MKGASDGSTTQLHPSQRARTASAGGAAVTARLSDAQWRLMEPLLPSASGHQGRPYADDHRTTVEGILWVVHNGATWRALPAEFGNWNTVYRRFRSWAERGVFSRLLEAFARTLDMSVALVDGTFVRVNQKATGARKGAAPRTFPEGVRPSGGLPGG